jgi:hypothetical protein
MAAEQHPPARGTTVLVNCLHEELQKPSELVLTCADANDSLTKMIWFQWGTQKAVGKGRQVVNDCRPTCVGGKFHSYPVNITLSHPQRSQHQRDSHFTQLTLVYPKNRPLQRPAVVTYEFWD